MRRRFGLVTLVCVWVVVFVSSAWSREASQQTAPAAKQASGWRLPPAAAEDKNPLTVNDAVLAAGKKVFRSKCERCHGIEGKGDGPDAESAHKKDMDLTNPSRVSVNPDGVVFYKVWNGRQSPKMPAFSEELSKEQVWAVVSYVQSLRAKK